MYLWEKEVLKEERTRNERRKKYTYEKKTFWKKRGKEMKDQRNVLMRKRNSVSALRTLCYKIADILAFQSTCWKESDAGMQPTTHIKHFSRASKPLAYFEQLSYHKLLHETLQIKCFRLILICCP
jgi:hypothetical protein